MFYEQCQYAKAMGFRVLAIDHGDEKKDMCLKLGAEEFVDFGNEDVVKSVQKHTGGLGAHAVILLAVSEKPFQQATEVCGGSSFFYIISRLLVSHVSASPSRRIFGK